MANRKAGRIGSRDDALGGSTARRRHGNWSNDWGAREVEGRRRDCTRGIQAGARQAEREEAVRRGRRRTRILEGRPVDEDVGSVWCRRTAADGAGGVDVVQAGDVNDGTTHEGRDPRVGVIRRREVDEASRHHRSGDRQRTRDGARDGVAKRDAAVRAHRHDRGAHGDARTRHRRTDRNIGRLHRNDRRPNRVAVRGYLLAGQVDSRGRAEGEARIGYQSRNGSEVVAIASDEDRLADGHTRGVQLWDDRHAREDCARASRVTETIGHLHHIRRVAGTEHAHRDLEGPGRVIGARTTDVNRPGTHEGERTRTRIRGDTTEQVKRRARGSGNDRSAATAHDGDYAIDGIATHNRGDVTVVLDRRSRVTTIAGHRKAIGHGDTARELNLRTPHTRPEAGNDGSRAETGVARDLDHAAIRGGGTNRIQRHATREGIVSAEDEQASTRLGDAEGTSDGA